MNIAKIFSRQGSLVLCSTILTTFLKEAVPSSRCSISRNNNLLMIQTLIVSFKQLLQYRFRITLLRLNIHIKKNLP